MELWDYVSLVVLVGLTCAVGVAQVVRPDRSSNFLNTNKGLSLFALSMSCVATFANAANTSGFLLEIYTQGMVFFFLALFNTIGAVIFAVLYLPVYYQLNTHTIYEYLELRFSSKLRVGFSVLQSALMLIMSSCFLYAVSLVLNQVTSVNLWVWVMVIGVTCALYTSLGGFKAVVWTDVAQQLVIYATLVTLVVIGLSNVGGVGVVWERLQLSKRSDFFVWTPDPNTQYSFWTLAIGYTTMAIAYLAVSQSIMQRCLSTATLTRAKLCVVMGCVGYSVCFVLIAACGVLITARYHDCDPLMMGEVKTRDQMLTLFAVETLSPYKGLTGVFVAGLVCATISTLSSFFNSLAAITMADYVRPLYPKLSARATMTLSKVISFIHGMACVGLVGVVQNAGGIIKVIFGLQNLLFGPTFSMFTVGMVLPWVTTPAALIGVAASMVLPTWVIVGQFSTPEVAPHLPFSASGCSNLTDVIYDHSQKSLLERFYSVSPLWLIVWSTLVSLVVSLVAGKIIGFQDPSKIDPALLFPVVRRFLKPRHVTQETELK